MNDSTYLPCPFCGSTDIDPTFWLRGDGVSGPGCNQCGATGEADGWNKRTLDVERLVRFLVDAVAEIDLNATADDLAETYSATYYANGGTPIWLENKTRAFRAVVLTALGMEATDESRP